MLDITTPIMVTANGANGRGWSTLFFSRAYDLKAGTIKDRLCAAQPTAFLGVPLVWEKIADKIRALGADLSDRKKAMGAWAKEKGLQHAYNCQLGGSGRTPGVVGLRHAV